MKKLLLSLSALLGIILFINVAYASDDYPDIIIHDYDDFIINGVVVI